MSVITIERKILEKNDTIASLLREEFLKNKIFAVNFLSSPGSGKTSLIEKICEYFGSRIKISVIVGDVQTDNDARRIGLLGIPAVQIITNGACHLEASLVRDAFRKIKDKTEFLIIENVGNLVCPSGFDLGESMKIAVLSTAEGDDKPLKYPVAFRNSQVMVMNKTDLLPYVNCDPAEMSRNVLSINPAIKIFRTSCKDGSGIDVFCDWLGEKMLL
jgi:hydrogenase nickel incorporation protein HypB